MSKYICLLSGMIGYTLGAKTGLMRRCACRCRRRMMRIMKRKLSW